MPFKMKMIITGLNVMLLERGEQYPCCPKKVRIVTVETPSESCGPENCKQHVPYLSIRVTETKVTSSNLIKPKVLPTEDGDQIALWPLTGLGLCVKAKQPKGERKPLEIIEGPSGEQFFDVSPSLADCGIEASKPPHESTRGYLHQKLITTSTPISGRCSAVLDLPRYGQLYAQNIAKKGETEIEWALGDKNMKFARELVWYVPSVDDRVSFKCINNPFKKLSLRPRHGQESIHLSLTNFPPRIPSEQLGNLDHFHCFYRTAEEEPEERIIPHPDQGGPITGGSVICPTPILEHGA